MNPCVFIAGAVAGIAARAVIARHREPIVDRDGAIKAEYYEHLDNHGLIALAYQPTNRCVYCVKDEVARLRKQVAKP